MQPRPQQLGGALRLALWRDFDRPRGVLCRRSSRRRSTLLRRSRRRQLGRQPGGQCCPRGATLCRRAGTSLSLSGVQTLLPDLSPLSRPPRSLPNALKPTLTCGAEPLTPRRVAWLVRVQNHQQSWQKNCRRLALSSLASPDLRLASARTSSEEDVAPVCQRPTAWDHLAVVIGSPRSDPMVQQAGSPQTEPGAERAVSREALRGRLPVVDLVGQALTH